MRKQTLDLFRDHFNKFLRGACNFMSSLADRIHTIVFVNPQQGIGIDDAIRVVETVLSSGYATCPLKRIVLTSQSDDASTEWSYLESFVRWCFAQQQYNVRIFSSLVRLQRSVARFLAKTGVFLAGEWQAPGFDEQGLRLQGEQVGFERAAAMRDGILLALEEGALKALEFQINNQNASFAESFIKACQEISVDFHFEMQERPCRSDRPPSSQAQKQYLAMRPPTNIVQHIASAVAQRRGVETERIVPPFFQTGGPAGACEYIRGGIFIRPGKRGRFKQTVCLSNWSVVSDDFLGEADPVGKSLRHPLIRANHDTAQSEMSGKCKSCELWSNCRGGCRSMAYLATGSQFSTDPNCWK